MSKEAGTVNQNSQRTLSKTTFKSKILDTKGKHKTLILIPDKADFPTTDCL